MVQNQLSWRRIVNGTNKQIRTDVNIFSFIQTRQLIREREKDNEKMFERIQERKM
jgi:hypothetical protein